MTRAVRDRILKDANGNISDHLRNHIHLTNCIHLKNHMHKQSPILSDRSLMRDLLALQRSRSLRDPSASPPSWQSDLLLAKKGESEARRSVGGDRRRDGRRASGCSPTFGSMATSKVAPGEVSKDASNEFSGNSGSRSKMSGRQQRGKQMKTLTEQLGDFEMDSDDGVVSSNVHIRGRQVQQGRTGDDEPGHEEGARGYCSGLNRGKRRKFRRARRHGNSGAKTGAAASRDVNPQNEMSVASNTYHGEEVEEEYDGQNVTRAPRNGCGIPWNWSRIHHRGKTFLDMAGRSISCGLSDPRSKKAGPSGFGGDLAEMPVASENSSVSSKTEAEALPLLVDGNTGNYEWEKRYSGELGIYADNLFDDSDLASEARGGGHQRKPKGRGRDRHQNLTQKYMPRTFKDLVGQNLVVQALSNAVTRRKVGLLYIFHGPHGTGKTSTARIVARALNCQSLDRPRPCGVCDSCVNHDMGKSRNIREVGPVSNFDFERIMDLLDNMVVSQVPSHYRVFIFDDCDTLSSECWNAVSKVIDRAPRRVVFILVCSSLDVLPHIIISRCQKFFFPKLKDADIIYTLQWIASKEGLEIDKDALKLIASRSDGSLRDAEMTLEQLSLLGQRISVPLVQELVGLISDEKLVDLLDLALSADTVNTVKNLRVIMETGVEPLGLMSQLATIITDILAGSYDCTRERPRRKFFRHHPLSKEDMEKLRQALKTLSEAEKQLRTSNDKLTWLTAALLQLAPDQQYLLPSSSAETSVDQSPLALNHGRQRPVATNQNHTLTHERDVVSSVKQSERSNDILIRTNGKQISGKGHKGVEEIWLEVLNKIQYIGIKEFLYQEGKLISISYGAAPTVQLMFSSHLTNSTAEKFRGHILQAFESVLGSSVTIEIRCELKRETKSAVNTPLVLSKSNDRSSQIRNTKGTGMPQSEIVEIAASPKETRVGDRADSHGESSKRRLRGVSGGEAEEVTLHKKPIGEINKCQSIVRSKVSLAHVIQQAEGCSQHGAWSRRKAVSIAEKLEQENLRLESRSRSLLCWKATRVTRRKLSRLRVRARKPRSLLKLVSCGKCLSTKSPR